MLKNRMKSWLLLWGLGAGLAMGVTTSAHAQVDPPFLSGEIKEVDKHIFAPADLSTFDRQPLPNTGYWGQINWVSMWTSAPDRATIGNSTTAPRLVIDGSSNGVGTLNLRPEFNSVDTSAFETERRSGHRTSFGYMEDDCGWSATVFDMGGANSEFDANNAEIILADPLGGLTGFIDINTDGFDDDLDGDLTFGRSGIDTSTPADGVPNTFAPPDLGDTIAQALRFDELNVRTNVRSWGVELNRDLRLGSHTSGSGSGFFGISYGVHYFRFQEDFLVTGTGGALFTDAFWNTEADNDLLGPKIAARWFRIQNRWTMEMEGSFTAALNFQSIRQNGQFDGNTGFSNFFAQNIYFNNTAHETEFTPIIQLGFNARYQITSKFYAEVGWRGMFLDNIARPETMINYAFPTMGILSQNNRQDVFLHGITAGVSFNR